MIRCLNCQQSKQFEGMTNANELLKFTLNDEGTKIEKIMHEDQDITDTIDEVFTDAIKTSDTIEITCSECSHVGSANELRNAFQNPGLFFDSENLCHCGGELWMDNVPGTKHYAFVCEKCEWVKPRASVSGA